MQYDERHRICSVLHIFDKLDPLRSCADWKSKQTNKSSRIGDCFDWSWERKKRRINLHIGQLNVDMESVLCVTVQYAVLWLMNFFSYTVVRFSIFAFILGLVRFLCLPKLRSDISVFGKNSLNVCFYAQLFETELIGINDSELSCSKVTPTYWYSIGRRNKFLSAASVR